jgi:uncharacterized protein with HEPN domain
MRNNTLYVKDILAAIEAIESFIEGMSFSQFADDDKTTSAVIRKFEVIGEAAKQVPVEMRDKFAAVPWKEMAGMRDKLIHFYFGIDYELVWATAKKRIPRIKPLITGILKGLENRAQEGIRWSEFDS